MDILIIEDDPMIAEALEDILHIMGHKTRWVSNGNSIESVFEHDTFPVIILDLELPGKPGFEVAKIILEISPETKILFSTGFSDQVDALEQLDEGSYHLIHKPFDINDIKNALARIS